MANDATAGRTRRRTALAAGALFVLVTGLIGQVGCRGARSADTAPPVAGERATEGFRAEHVELEKHLDHIDGLVGGLASATASEREESMSVIVGFLEGHLVQHAEWEERALYPLVDRQAGGGAHPFTATMRHEHRIIRRWLGELAQLAASPTPDVAAFTRQADKLLGLVRAHFEEEEEVLLPIIDRSMTRAEFERALERTEHAE